MIAGSPILAVLLCISFQAFGNPITSEDIQICTQLCNKCNGKTIIKEGKCECSIANDDKKGAECMNRITNDAEFRMTFEIPKTHAQDEGRLVRCLHTSRRKYKPEEIQQVAKYFMDGGPLKESPGIGEMVGASEPDLEEPPHSEIVGSPSFNVESPNLDLGRSEEETIVRASNENPWCPSSVLENSQSGRVQPENTNDRIVGSTQESPEPDVDPAETEEIVGSRPELEQTDVCPAESEEIVGSPPELEQPDVSPAETEEIVGSPPELEQPDGCPAESEEIVGSPPEVEQPDALPAKTEEIVGSPPALQPPGFSLTANGMFGDLQRLQLPQVSSDPSGIVGAPQQTFSDPGGFLTSLQLQVPQLFSTNSGGMLGSSQAEQPSGVSADPKGILGNFQLRLPQFSPESESTLGASQSEGLSSNPKGFLGNLQFQLPPIPSADSRLLGSSQAEQPLDESADPKGILGNFQLRIPQFSPESGSMLGASQSEELSSNPIGFLGNLQFQLPPIPPADSRLLGAAQPIEQPQFSPEILREMLNPQPILDVFEAIGRIQIPVPQTQNYDSDVVGAKQNTDSDIVGATRRVYPLLSKDSGDPEEILGDSLPVQPGYSNPSETSVSDPKTAAPQFRLYKLDDIVAALAQRPLSSILKGLGRLQLPQSQVGATSQEALGAPTINSNSNNDPNDLEIVGAAASSPDDAEPDKLGAELEDEPSVGAPSQPEFGTSGSSWMPQTCSSIVGIFQPLLQQGLQLARLGISGQPVELQLAQDGMEKPQTDLSERLVGSARRETNLAAPRIAILNTPLLRAQFIPNSNSYLINSQFSLPMLQAPSSPTAGASRLNPKNNGPNLEGSSGGEQIVGAPRNGKQTGKKEISQRGTGLKKIRQRPRTLSKSAKEPSRNRLSKSKGSNTSQTLSKINGSYTSQRLSKSKGSNTRQRLSKSKGSNTSQRLSKSKGSNTSNRLSNSKGTNTSNRLSTSKDSNTSKRLSTSKGSNKSKRLSNSKFPREAIKSSEELPDEVQSPKVNSETTENIMEEAVEKEILKKSEEITLEKELENTSEKTLEKRADKPEVKLIEPEVKVIVPEVKLIEPEVKVIVPEVKLIEPEVKHIEPEVKLNEPEVKNIEPEVKLVEPEVKAVEPEVKVVEPEVKVVEPKVKLIEPKVKVIEPEEKSIKKVPDKTNLKIRITKVM